MIIVINDHSRSRNNATLMIVTAHQMAQKTMHGTAGVTGGVTVVQEATCTMTKAAPSCRVLGRLLLKCMHGHHHSLLPSR